MMDRSHGAALPIVGRVEGLDCLAHAVLDALGVLACVALGVVAHQDRLTEGDPIRDPAHLAGGMFGIVGALVAIVLEAVGTVFGPVDQAGIIVANLAGQLDAQVGTHGRPHRRDELILLRCPREPGRFQSVIDGTVQPGGTAQAQLVVIG